MQHSSKLLKQVSLREWKKLQIKHFKDIFGKKSFQIIKVDNTIVQVILLYFKTGPNYIFFCVPYILTFLLRRWYHSVSSMVMVTPTYTIGASWLSSIEGNMPIISEYSLHVYWSIFSTLSFKSSTLHISLMYY